MTYLQAIIIGLIQGVTELFPVSSLGHSVLLPALFGWHNIVAAQTAKESFFLAFLVGLHCATAIALLIFYRKRWIEIIRAFFHTVSTRKIVSPNERLAWLLIIATIPAGLTGVLFEHEFRVIFAKPLAAAVFLTINGLILFAGEKYRKNSEKQSSRGANSRANLSSLSYSEAGIIGVAQIFALLAGISRSGITMVVGLGRGMNHEDAANFSFLLATPIILAAGLYKLPDLLGKNGDGVRVQVLVGSIAAGIAAYFAVRYLTKFFKTKTLTPFAWYCFIFGLLMIVRFGFFK
ncbi:MAG: undecaprenyl-diphosphate phosphatase [Candidatus Saccharimonadia bacterium]